MKKSTIIALSVVGVIGLLTVILIGSSIGSFNTYSKLENKVEAAQEDNKNVLDNTRKSIREAASISDKEVAALEGIITGYAEARSGGEGVAGKGAMVTVGMIQEAVPSITKIETLNKLQNILVAGRKDWQNSQTRLLDLKRQADNMLDVFPSGTVLKMLGKEEIEVVIVTSSETKKNFETGEDNESWVK